MSVESLIDAAVNSLSVMLPITGQPIARAHASDAGYDMRADGDAWIASGAWCAVPTGTAVAIPGGYAGFVCPRSGLAAKHGVTVLNAPGIIDAGYRGEIKVLIINHGREPYRVRDRDRIAQLVITPVHTPLTVLAPNLPASDRGTNGFGSTGQ